MDKAYLKQNKRILDALYQYEYIQGSLQWHIDILNHSIRNNDKLDPRDTLFLDIFNRSIDACFELDNARLYRGIEEFNEEYLSDPGITFKSLDINVALRFGDVLMVIDYPGKSKHIYLNGEYDFDEPEYAMLTHSNEKLVLKTKTTEYINNKFIDVYYLLAKPK